MDTSVVVSVYKVDAQGRTTAYAGNGTLVHPLFVRLNAPLSAQLAHVGANQPRLRLGISPTHPENSLVDVIDAVAVHVAVLEDGETYVGVSLSRPASSAADPVDVPRVAGDDGEGGELDGNLRMVLGADVTDGEVEQRSWPCRLFDPPPWFCLPRDPGHDPLHGPRSGPSPRPGRPV